METDEFALRLKGWRLATAEVLYYMPDHPKLLQSFVWQTLDLAPSYPRIHKFLDFWRAEIDAVIHSVRLASGEQLAPAKALPVVLVCKAGQSAEGAASMLRKAGFERVFVLDGGIDGWQQAGLPLAKGR